MSVLASKSLLGSELGSVLGSESVLVECIKERECTGECTSELQ